MFAELGAVQASNPLPVSLVGLSGGVADAGAALELLELVALPAWFAARAGIVARVGGGGAGSAPARGVVAAAAGWISIACVVSPTPLAGQAWFAPGVPRYTALTSNRTQVRGLAARLTTFQPSGTANVYPS